MRRNVMRLALFGVVLCSVVLVLIRAHPYDDREVRKLLLSDDCTSPCFLGIRPGVTTLHEAINLLRISQWVQTETISYSEADYGGGAVWSWNRQAAPALSNKQSSLISRLDNGVQLVDLLYISTTIPIGDIYLTLGATSYTGTGDTGMPHEAYVALFYLEQGISIWSNVSCPIQNHTLWIEPVDVQLRHDLKQFRHFTKIGSYC